MISGVIQQLTELDDDALDARIRDLEVERRRVTAEQAAAIAVAASRNLHSVDGHHSMKGYLRATINCSNGEAAQHLRLAKLIDTVPEAGQRLLDGRIGIGQANELARARSNPRCGNRLADVTHLLLDNAEHLSFEGAQACVRRWETLADLNGAHRDQNQTIDARTASISPLGSGIDLRASGGDPVTAAEIIAILDNFAEAEFHRDTSTRQTEFGNTANDQPLPRTASQRRFDALTTIFRRAASTPANARAPKPIVNILIDETTFTETLTNHGLAPKDAAHQTVEIGRRRCETSSGINVHPDDALRAAIYGYVRRVVLNSANVITSMGRRRRLFGNTMRDAAKLMTHQCTYPGCTVPAAHAQIDHLQEWANNGGETNTENSNITCGPHNRLKNRGYNTKRNSHGQTIYYRPNGKQMTTAGQTMREPRNPNHERAADPEDPG
ncbi:MAG: HNH endonuclease [Ilumatobacteraceae bacterium]|nr:HNH endonuclease [Ilumatobacteraceae bacterium]